MADIHIPKPIHGWRQFFGEVGIIMFGVLLALALEQTVEWLHWRHKVDVAKEALSEDASLIIWSAREREALSPCLAKRLTDLQAIIDSAADSGRLPPVGSISRPSLRAWSFASWPSAMGSETASHFPGGQLAALGAVQHLGLAADELNLSESQLWARLRTMSGPGRRLDAGELALLRRDLAEAFDLGITLRAVAHQMVRGINDTHALHIDPEARSALIPSSGLCQPIDRDFAPSGLSDKALEALRGKLTN